MDVVRGWLDYNAESGRFVYAKGHLWEGQMGCGLSLGDGYRHINFPSEYGGRFAAHRIVWKWVHGRDPRGVIDHINGIRDDNRIANLRDVSPIDNAQNNHGRLWRDELARRKAIKKAQREAAARKRKELRGETLRAVLSFGV